MRYLITTENAEPFFTDYFDMDNHYNPDEDMMVYDLQAHMYYSGSGWFPIESDHL